MSVHVHVYIQCVSTCTPVPVFMYICVYTCCVSICTYIHTYYMYVHVYTAVNALCSHTRMSVYMHCVIIHVHEYSICQYMYMYIYSVSVHVHCMFMYIWVYMCCVSTCTYIHTHTMCMCYMLFFTIGRSSMKQYMPMKPVKRGFKVWVRADAVNGYFSTFDVYVGKPADGTVTEVGLGERVVLQLSEDLRGQKYQLYFDNFFTSCSLMETLTSQQLYACGTTHPTRRGFPETLKTVSLERGKSAFCQCGDLVACVWMDKKPVTMLSTLSQAEGSNTALRRQRDGTRVPVQCTDTVVLYNKYMAGFNKGDQIQQYYRVRTRCYKY